MNIIPVSQGTPEWVALREQYNTASEAPAALGHSKYVSRSELLYQKQTGLAREIDSRTQALFDRGHAAEAAARAIAERIVGGDLYPVTATLDVGDVALLASLDGATMDEEIIWEHKLWSESLAAEVSAGELSPHYTIQLDQQLLVSGAKKCLFMTSDGTEERMAYCWYESSQEKFDALIAGWAQFHADLAAYVPPAVVEKPVAESILALPALVVQTRGEVVTSNLPEFKLAAQAFIDKIKTDLVTDEDFVNADATVKFCEETEGKLEHAKAAALAQTATIDEVLRTIDQIREQVRAKRLHLFSLIKTKKDQIRETMLAEGKRAYAAHIAELDRELSPLRLALAAPDFAGAMKSKRTLKTLQDAVDTALAQAKATANTVAQDWRGKVAWFNVTALDHKFLFNDLQGIIGKPTEDFQLVVNTRLENHKRQEAEKAEALRTKIAAEEKANAEAALAIKQANQTAAQSATAAAQTAQATDNVRASVEALRTPTYATPAPTINRVPVALLDAADAAQPIDPTDEQIVEALTDCFGLNAAQAIARLERFDGAKARQAFGLPAAGAPNITMIPVTSSQIAAIGHDPANNILAIQFPAKNGSGSVYHYRNFTAELFEEFRNSESVGSYFGKNIKPHTERFPFEKVPA